MKKGKIAIAGNILLDIVKRVDAWPKKGMLVNIRSISRAVGGCVCNTGIDLKRLAPETEIAVYGRLGRDEYGEFVRNYMCDSGLDVRGVKYSESAATSFTDVITSPDGERTFFHVRGANAEFTAEDVDVDALDCEIFHLGYLLLLDSLDAKDPEYGTKAAKLLHDVRARGIGTSVDLVSEQSERFGNVIVPALKYCDYAVINEVEGGRLTGIDASGEDGKPSSANIRRICEKIFDLGVKKSVVIHCPAMSCALDVSGEFTALPSLRLPPEYIVGSVGAGDAFCAGMLYAFLHGMNLSDGMRLASCSAACNLSAADSVSGARSVEKALELEKKFGRRKIKC